MLKPTPRCRKSFSRFGEILLSMQRRFLAEDVFEALLPGWDSWSRRRSSDAAFIPGPSLRSR
jgi:hypothetical protein